MQSYIRDIKTAAKGTRDWFDSFVKNTDCKEIAVPLAIFTSPFIFSLEYSIARRTHKPAY